MLWPRSEEQECENSAVLIFSAGTVLYYTVLCWVPGICVHCGRMLHIVTSATPSLSCDCWEHALGIQYPAPTEQSWCRMLHYCHEYEPRARSPCPPGPVHRFPRPPSWSSSAEFLFNAQRQFFSIFGQKQPPMTMKIWLKLEKMKSHCR